VLTLKELSSGRCSLYGCYYSEAMKTLPGAPSSSETKQLRKALAATLRVIFGGTGNPIADASKDMAFTFDSAQQMYKGIIGSSLGRVCVASF
jgi:hypothetical protein